ncbi:hypothetical protein [Leptolyngbya sp. AN10]|uniref:hypothetical protein n=1 Tax=Leptolyngbya sp. AN10 TaxID=3423365 RepID=UPI003D319CE9
MQQLIPNWLTEIVKRRCSTKSIDLDWRDSDLGFDFSDIHLWVQRGNEVLDYSFDQVGAKPRKPNSTLRVI